MKKPLVIIAGPTAVGKTEFSISLAKAIHGEIISADSMQIYQGMDIGSAKITKEEMDGIPHYLIDELSPFDEFHVVKFQEMAKAAMEKIYKNGHIPIVVGGTGFYIQALLKDVDFRSEEGDPAYRKQLEDYAAKMGADALHELLKAVDEKAAEEIHANNIKRTVRALEYYHLTGRPISEHNEAQRKKKPAYHAAYFVLTMDRARLYERINLRVDRMLEQGLTEEVKKLMRMGCTKNMVSMQGLGYKEMLSWLSGECTYEEAVEVLKRETRHFAKRQLTWFKREPDVIWFDKDELGTEEALLRKALDILQERGICKS